MKRVATPRENSKGHDPDNAVEDMSGEASTKSANQGKSMKCFSSIQVGVLIILCLQNSIFTVLRRYSQGVLKEVYSKHELLLIAELIKIIFSAWMISTEGLPMAPRLESLIGTSKKMAVLAFIYGAMNILSFVALRNISAGMFAVFAQCKILSTAVFSRIILNREYSWTKWRALAALMLGVLLFSQPVWGDPSKHKSGAGANPLLGTAAVLAEVTMSGFASIYFEKVVKSDASQLSIWERNFQLAFCSFPIYVAFILYDQGGEAGIFGGWSWVAVMLAILGAAGGLLVALSIKYADAILKTLATTGAIILSSVLDNLLLGGPLTPTMMIAGLVVIIAIMNYTFDATPPPPKPSIHVFPAITPSKSFSTTDGDEADEEMPLTENEEKLG